MMATRTINKFSFLPSSYNFCLAQLRAPYPDTSKGPDIKSPDYAYLSSFIAQTPQLNLFLIVLSWFNNERQVPSKVRIG